MGILSSYFSISLISAQSRNHKNDVLREDVYFWSIAHLLYDVSDTNEWYFLSKSVHDQDPNGNGLNRDLF